MIRAASMITHLFFADDSLVFSKANEENCHNLLEILEIYAKSSGQVVNFDKSTILFSPNERSDTKQQILNESRIHAVAFFEKYLGLSTMLGRTRNES